MSVRLQHPHKGPCAIAPAPTTQSLLNMPDPATGREYWPTSAQQPSALRVLAPAPWAARFDRRVRADYRGLAPCGHHRQRPGRRQPGPSRPTRSLSARTLYFLGLPCLQGLHCSFHAVFFWGLPASRALDRGGPKKPPANGRTVQTSALLIDPTRDLGHPDWSIV